MILIAHTADLHYRPSRAAACFTSLSVFEDGCKDVDLAIIAGDIHDYPIQNTGASHFPELVERISRIATRAPVVMVQGTPTHDSDNSLDVYAMASENVTILQIGRPYFLIDSRVLDGSQTVGTDRATAIIFGLPEPQKKHLIAADSETTLDHAIRTVLLGYGAIRSQYPALPCILVYHGQVRGARMANGEQAEGGVSIDDLTLVGADYIAMGDIHVPQRVGSSRGLCAYYAGAAHPNGDWKDAGFEFGFNRVTIDGHVATVERRRYPHPQYKKIEIRRGDPIPADSVAGLRVWLEVTAKKEDVGLINPDELLSAMLDAGACEGSRVTIKAIPTETVRTANIGTLRRLRDKFALWMTNSGKETTDELAGLCDKVEELSSHHGYGAQGGRFSFDRLILRGSKGIWKKRRVDEIDLDLSAYDPGIVALVGPNGYGKTTIMDSFHVWTEFPSRPGPAHGNFRLKDSRWEVYATDRATGTQYRKRVIIDPTLKQPKCEYWLDWRASEFDEWASYPGITGRLADYESVVTKIFGSFELYIRTAYQMQSPTAEFPDISKATRATKKQIMAELSGLDFYDHYRETAETERKDFEAASRDAATRAEALAGSLGNLDEMKASLSSLEEEKGRTAGRILVLLDQGRRARREADLLERENKANEALIWERDSLRDQIATAEKAIADGRVEILRQEDILAQKPAAETRLARAVALSQEEKAIVERRNKMLEEHAERVAEYQRIDREVSDSLRALEAERVAVENTHRDAVSAIEKDISAADSAIAAAEALIKRLSAETCPTCGQTLPAEALEKIAQERARVEKAIEENAGVIDQKQIELDEAARARDDALADIARRLTPIERPRPPEIPEDAEGGKLEAIRAELKTIDVSHETNIVMMANSAEAKILNLQSAIDKNVETIRTASEKEAGIVIDDTLAARFEEARKGLEALREAHSTEVANHERICANLEHAACGIQEYQERMTAIEELRAESSRAAVMASSWKMIETACGPNGIPALEIDAVCPTIAAVASKLLESYDDGRYSIRFDTLRDGKKGNQIEDFLIIVIDSKDGEEQEFGTLSGGESAWIRKALQDAFGIIRGQNSGVCYLTGFLDESDSALFPEARIAYYRMLSAAHWQSVRHHTVMVTHSPELQVMIQQSIDVTKL